LEAAPLFRFRAFLSPAGIQGPVPKGGAGFDRLAARPLRVHKKGLPPFLPP